MATWLKQSTSVDVPIGPFLDADDGKTIEDGLTITQPDVRLKKNGGNWAQKAAAQTLTHEEAGWYEVTLDATDTNTLGHLVVAIHEAGALPVWREFMVVPANEYDSLVSGTDALDVEVASIAANAITATSIASDAIAAAKIATGAITNAKFAAGAIDASAIASDAIAAAKIATGAITSAKFAAGAIDAAAIAANAIGASELATDAVTEIVDAIFADARNGLVHTGTAAAVGAATLTLAANSFANDEIVGSIVFIRSADTGAGQSRFITDFVAATEVATVSPAWTTEPTGTVVYDIIAAPPATAGVGTVDANVVSISGDSTAADTLELFAEALDQTTGQLDSGSLAASTITATSIATAAITAAKFGAGAIDAAAVADGAIDAGAIAANAITSAKFASGAITATAIATDAITAAKVASDVTTEIQSGLATASALATVSTNVDAILADTGTAGVVIAQATQRAIADEVLDRDLAMGASGGARNVQSALRVLRNKKTIDAGTLTVFEEDDSTQAWTADVTTAAGDPISGVDPA